MDGSVLFIRHLGQLNFQIANSNDELGTIASLPSPYERRVEGREAFNLQGDLSWYLEEYLSYSTPPDDTATRILEARDQWGRDVFNLLFSGESKPWYEEARQAGLDSLTLNIVSNDPAVLAWPWEALIDFNGVTLAHECDILRQLDDLGNCESLPETLPQDQLNILLVVARPFGDEDVNYQALARPLIDLISSNDLPITVDLIRPPSFEQLQSCLTARPGHYHLIHFDGHGAYDTFPHGSPPIEITEGVLVFETSLGEPQFVTATELTEELTKHNIPIVILNACQSAKIDERAKDPYASVAAALMKAGIHSVVAMGHSLYVSGAEQFVPAFYQSLIGKGRVGEAIRSGRKAMLVNKSRSCDWYEHDLEDWLVPVLYQRDAIRLPVENYQPPSPSQLLFPDDYIINSQERFIGRQQQVQTLDRLFGKKSETGILIRGMAGIGKTSLAKGYLSWLRDTGGFLVPGQNNPNAFFTGALWYDFEGRVSIEDMLSDLKNLLFQNQAVYATFEDLIKALYHAPVLLVWDNFESASDIPGTSIKGLLNQEQRTQLLELLKQLHGGQTKVLITSRTEESWLGSTVFRLPTLIGLPYEECREYCKLVVSEQGFSLNRDQLNQLQPVIKELGGHPVALRIALQSVNAYSVDPNQILEDFRQHYSAQSGSDYSKRMFSAIQLLIDKMPEEWQVILPWFGLHRGFVDINFLGEMASAVNQPLARELIEQTISALAAGGLLQFVGSDTYRMLPTLSECCAEAYPATEEQTMGFIEFMAAFAGFYAPKESHEQRVPVTTHQFNVLSALSLAHERMSFNPMMALHKVLGIYAQYQSQWPLAEHHYQRWSEAARDAESTGDESNAYHQLGMVAYERRDFDQAEAWYLKSLEIKEKRGNEHGMATSYHQLGVVAEERGDLDQAEAWYRKSLVIKEKQGNEHGMTASCHQLGMVAEKRRDFDQAEVWYRKTLAIVEKQGNEYGMATIYYQLGMLAEERGDFDQAGECCRKSLAIEEKQGNERGMADNYHQLGIVAQLSGDFNQAEAWFRQSLTIREKQGNEYGMAQSYHQLGMLAQERRDFEQAEAWYRKSLAIHENQGSEYGMAASYHQLGRVAEKQRVFDQAEEWYRKALAIDEKQGNEHGMGTIYGLLGRLAQEQQQWLEAGSNFVAAFGCFAKDSHHQQMVVRDYFEVWFECAKAEQMELQRVWLEAGLSSLEEFEELVKQAESSDSDKKGTSFMQKAIRGLAAFWHSIFSSSY